ncbi:unnamed protein product [Clonostachys chloroleuca]|uniref:Uncharacterized protein n=1 Tax=Clonostachys chloroleuca TaxID=1926264 RepID=A0AA35Q5C8_9HYPO|nr:unnamed protein product [Clonostachys chloroleuca]
MGQNDTDGLYSIAPGPVIESELVPEIGNLFPKFSDKISKKAVDLWLFDATVHMELFFQTPDGDSTSKPLIIGGNTRAFGGMDRSWESLGLAGAFSDSVFLRARVGPYDIQHMLLIGKPNKNYPQTASASLYYDGRLVCAPRAVRYLNDYAANTRDGNTMVIARLSEGEDRPAVFRHPNFGCHLEFRKGDTKLHAQSKQTI